MHDAYELLDEQFDKLMSSCVSTKDSIASDYTNFLNAVDVFVLRSLIRRDLSRIPATLIREEDVV